MVITKAMPGDIPAINRLVNSAYRGEESQKGWTTEAHLLDGIRIDEQVLEDYFQHAAVTILKYTNENEVMTGCVYLEVKPPRLYLGMLSVSPVLQGNGVGKALLEEAEVFARQHNCHIITMNVIRSREELINWYERRGYLPTGEIEPFEGAGRFGIPRQPLEMIVMEKQL